MCLSSSDEELGGAGHDHPSSVPLPPPVPENLQPQAPHSLNTRPFIQPPSIPLMTVASERLSRVLQDASSAFRDQHLPPPVPENLQPENTHLDRTRALIQPSPPSTPLTAVTPDRPCRVLQGASPAFRDAMFARLLTVLEEIKETQRVHGRMIQSLLTQRDASAVTALPADIVFS